ncbi:hypothetical protein IGI72_003804 [Enterococcus sp. DIV1059_2]
MSVFDLFSEILSTGTVKIASVIASDTKTITSQQEDTHKRSRDFASTYRSIEKELGVFKMKSELNLLDENATGSSTEDSDGNLDSVGTSNSKLFGLDEYKGPDSTATRNPWSSNGGPFTSGIKAKLKKMAEFDDIILKHSKNAKIDPMMVKIIALMESSGNPNTQASDADSRGLTQITPGNVGVNIPHPEKLYEPDYNIEMFMKCAEGKAAVAKSIGIATSVKNIAHLWNGYDVRGANNGAKYRDAFAEIYEGFGLSANNNYKTLQGIKADSSGSSGGTDGGKDPSGGKKMKIVIDKVETDFPQYKGKLKLKSYNGFNYNTSGSYPFGQCTFYVFNRMYQLNSKVDDYMGNGGFWGDSGRQKGFKVSSTPKVGTAMSIRPGDAGSSPLYGHVTVVEHINSDGSVLVSECNVRDPGSGRVSWRVINASVVSRASFIEGK